jgi:Trk K+ transport system NAD-binding subunit/Kef-type K+ transport system membrane component KefB
MQIAIFSLSFFLVALASKKIGDWFSRIGLPYITGYLLAGAVAGPFVLDLLSEEAATSLRFVDELSLGIIAFVAGSELYLKEIRSRIKSISWITTAVVLAALPMIGVAIFFLTNLLPFTADMTTMDRLAVAILGSTILLALSPASTIAVIKEARAKGNYSRTILGVTVTMDVVIIIFFAVAVAVAGALLTGGGFDGSFALLLLVDLSAAVVIGFLVGKLLQAVLDLTIDRRIKMAAILGIGYAVFAGGHWLIEYSYANLPLEIHIEPLLVAMIGGFMVTNYSRHRESFAAILHDISPAIYVAFFTLTGVTIKLDILLQTWPIAVAIFVARSGGIFVGSIVGSLGAQESNTFARYAWLGLITQAGIALGLAREVATEFPTLVISVVVLNEIFGPLMLKFALQRTGEADLPEEGAVDEVRDALILGVEPQSLALARQLQANNWRVIIADTDATHVERLAAEDVDERHIPDISSETMAGMISNRTDALVALLEDDQANLRACDLAFSKGVPRLIVRLRDMSLANEFAKLNALIVDQSSAMVYLLEQSVRSPLSAAMLLHQDSSRSLVQVTVSNPDIDGQLVRDLRLPADVLLLDVSRDGAAIVPDGYTRIRLRDDVTLLGKEDSLKEAVWKLGY